MKKGFILFLALITAFCSAAGFSAAAAEDVFARENAKVIYYVTENESTVDVTMMLSGEITQVIGFTMYTAYDSEALEYIDGSFKTGELIEGWTMPNTMVTNSAKTSPSYIYFTATPGMEENLYRDIALGEEKEIASFSFNKKDGGEITDKSIFLQTIKRNDASLVSIVNSLTEEIKLFNIRYDTRPDKFVVSFKPYIADGSTPQPESISISGYNSDTSLISGETLQLTAACSPASAENAIIWHSENDCARVDENGVVTAVSEGDAVITASAGTVSASIKIPVAEKAVSAESVKISNAAFDYLVQGDNFDFDAEISPSNATDKRIIWSVSGVIDADIDTVSGVLKTSRVVDALTITASLASDPKIKDSVTIKVIEKLKNTASPASASLIIPEKMYPNPSCWQDNSYSSAISLFTETHGYILRDSASSGWANNFDIVYFDNFSDKNLTDIKHENGVVTIGKNATAAENLTIGAKIVRKATGETVLTVESNPFTVFSAIPAEAISGVSVDGIDSSSKITGENVVITIDSGDSTVYTDCMVNGAVYYGGNTLTIPSSAFEQGAYNVVVKIHSDDRNGSLGYSMNSLIKTYEFKAEK